MGTMNPFGGASGGCSDPCGEAISDGGSCGCGGAGCVSCGGKVINLGSGKDGQSAYDLAVSLGFVGTQDEWLASLQGKDGRDGIDGIDGTNGVDGEQGPIGPTSVTGYRIAGFAASNVTAEEILLDHVVTQDFTIAADFFGSRASVDTGPAADWVASIQKNEIEVGTLKIQADGLIVWNSGGLMIDFAAGDIISMIAPALADAAIARLRYTIEGAVA